MCLYPIVLKLIRTYGEGSTDYIERGRNMPKIITMEEMRSFSKKACLNESTLIKDAASKDISKNIFLSYSSKDIDILPYPIKILTNHGGKVYIDKGDDRLPEPPSSETAEILKDTIKKLPRMVVFVTDNSKNSNWIPWELGLGDGSKSNYDVAIFPSVEKSYDIKWTEQEYLGLYSRIVYGRLKGYEKDVWMVYDYKINTAIELSKWIGNNSRGVHI